MELEAVDQIIRFVIATLQLFQKKKPQALNDFDTDGKAIL